MTLLGMQILYLGVRVIFACSMSRTRATPGCYAESTARSPGSATEAMLFD